MQLNHVIALPALFLIKKNAGRPLELKIAALIEVTVVEEQPGYLPAKNLLPPPS